MMLEHLGEVEAAKEIVAGIERVLAERTLRTRDLGGNGWHRDPAARRWKRRWAEPHRAERLVITSGAKQSRDALRSDAFR